MPLRHVEAVEALGLDLYGDKKRATFNFDVMGLTFAISEVTVCYVNFTCVWQPPFFGRVTVVAHIRAAS